MAEIKRAESEQPFFVVEQWFNNLAEHRMAGKLDRSVLRGVLSECGAEFDISPELLETLGEKHYPASARRGAVSAIWRGRYEEFVAFAKETVLQSENSGIDIPKLPKSGKKYIGLVGLLDEITSYAAGNDETFPAATFQTRVTARAYNGFVLYELSLKDPKYRMCITVPGYNTAEIKFLEGDGVVKTKEVPFAPLGFPSQFASLAWEHIKSWKK